MMKNILLCLFVQFSSTFSDAQTITLDSCNQQMITKPSTDDLKTVFGSEAISLERHYDWSNSTLNCHLNQAVTNHKKELKIYNSILAKSLVGYAVALTGSLFALTGKGGAGLALTGIGLTVSFAGNKKMKAKARDYATLSTYHGTQVTKYMQKMAW